MQHAAAQFPSYQEEYPLRRWPLNVTVDTAMKQDAVIKSVRVTSSDPERPVVTLDLKMFVLNPHTGLDANSKANIFTDRRCAVCHVDRGTGHKGMDLYNADCAMCHGPKAEGAVGPPLIGPYDDKAYLEHMVAVTSLGSKTRATMPGFLLTAGGPLSLDEISSIVEYLRRLSRLQKENK